MAASACCGTSKKSVKTLHKLWVHQFFIYTVESIWFNE
ncbi:hypothetical protein YPPY76_3005 [Yersinia pestis PY-76]|nr:hypothetical protein YPPY76_3005 [Yersinia pestis PY-76]